MSSSTPSRWRCRIFSVQALVRRHAGERGLLLRRGDDVGVLEVVDAALERVRAAVEDQVVGQLPLRLGDLVDRAHVRRVHDRDVEPGVDGVMQEHGVQDGPRRRVEPERDVRDAQHRPHPRQETVVGSVTQQCRHVAHRPDIGRNDVRDNKDAVGLQQPPPHRQHALELVRAQILHHRI